MNKTIAVILSVIMMVPIYALAISDQDIRFTVHNFAYNTDTSKGVVNGTERDFNANNPSVNQVCIFCHTPHNAAPAIPLWNKTIDNSMTAQYQLYTSSQSLTNTVKHNSSLSATGVSLLCLTCHDGKTAINVLHNAKDSERDATDGNGDAIIDLGNGAVATPLSIFAFAGAKYPSDIGASRDGSGRIIDPEYGYNLTDDHPIGFSYTAAQADAPTKLHALSEVATLSSNTVRFYGSDNRVECSSCHNPHVFYGYGRTGGARVRLNRGETPEQLARTPFLVRDNIGSGLCLSCHIK